MGDSNWFCLYFNVYVVEDSGYTDPQQLHSDDFGGTGKFVRVGERRSFSCEDTGEWDNLKSLITKDETVNTDIGNRLWFYYVPTYNTEKHVTLQDISSWEYEPGVGEFGKATVVFTTNGTEVGKMVFQCSNTPENENDVNVTPFNIITTGDTTCLTYNGGSVSEILAEGKPNGIIAPIRECSIFIIDPEKPVYNASSTGHNVTLPSVYKPFYMRVLTVIEDVMRQTTSYTQYRTAATIFNGVGVNKKTTTGTTTITTYTVGTFEQKFELENGLTGSTSIDITGDTPTLLMHEWGRRISNSGNSTEIWAGNIHLEYEVEEAKPTDITGNVFPARKLSYINDVCFYDIEYSVEEIDMAFNNRHLYYVDIKSITGETSENVRYFIVSPKFYKDYCSTCTGATITCNSDLKLELNPQSATTQTSKKTSFLSLYGAEYYSSPSEAYMDAFIHGGNSGYTVNKKFVIELDIETLKEAILPDIENSGQPTEVSVPVILSESERSAFLKIIGISDPLVDLLVRDRNQFIQEKKYNRILPPHKDFVTIMRVYQNLQNTNNATDISR